MPLVRRYYKQEGDDMMRTTQTNDRGIYEEPDVLRYDYDRQVWLRGDLVLPCAHQPPQADCYACAHAGEQVAS